MHVQRQLAMIQKKDMTMAAYFNKVKTLADTLSTCGVTLSEEEIVAYILTSLDANYDLIVTSLTTRSEPASLNDTYAHLLSFEMRQEQNQATMQVNLVTCGGRGGGRSRGGRGRGGQGHSRDSRERHGQGLNNYTTNKPTCQVCGKVGHIALKCYHRFDHSYQAEEIKVAAAAHTASGYAVDTNWYTDTGANDHITGELDRLTVREKYDGKDQVQAANGSGLNHEEGTSSRQ